MFADTPIVRREPPDENEFLLTLGIDLEETPYEAIEVIGRGAMGAVVGVRHKRTGLPFVVKVLHDSADAEMVQRLQNEARVLGRLSHPNLLVVHDLGTTTTGRAYLVTERLRGQTFDELLKARGALPWQEAVDMVVQALRGLAVAHEAGVVHRDVKTSNLFLSNALLDGKRIVKVLDFGIVKVQHGGVGPLATMSPREQETAAGMIVGTPRFLSPEQIRAERIDARSDIYGVGVVLYCLLVGRAPFQAKTLLDLVRAHIETPAPAPSAAAPFPLPPALDRAVKKALEKDAADRFATATEMADELERIARPSTDRVQAPLVAAPTPKPPVAGSTASALAMGEGPPSTQVRLPQRPWIAPLAIILSVTAIILVLIDMLTRR
ncbi:MAG: serine/threonine-protein kinase [Polyangiaceae bacterium]